MSLQYPPKHAKQAKQSLEKLKLRKKVLNILIGDVDEEIERFEMWLYRDATGNPGLMTGVHECPKSPTSVCAYDHDNDPCGDDCVFCHEPSERK